MRIKRVTNDLGDTIASVAIWMMGFGVILAIWGGVWLVYLYRNPPESEVLYFIATGIFLSGIDLGVIGLTSGYIGRSAREPADDADKQPERIAVVTPDTAPEPRP